MPNTVVENTQGPRLEHMSKVQQRELIGFGDISGEKRSKNRGKHVMIQDDEEDDES